MSIARYRKALAATIAASSCVAALVAIGVISNVVYAGGGGGEVVLPAHLLALMFGIGLAAGLIGVLAGVGGGVVAVPLMLAFTPFHIDIIRGTGLLIAATVTLMSAKRLLQQGLANWRLAVFTAGAYFMFAVLGSFLGLWITAAMGKVGDAYVRIALGCIMLFVFLLFAFPRALGFPTKRVEYPEVPPGKESKFFEKIKMALPYYEASLKRVIEYKLTNPLYALPCFAGVGFISGCFGLGAGWAMTPVFVYLMYAPLKVAVSTTVVLISLGDIGALWIYLMSGAVWPIVAIPALIGIIAGTQISTRILYFVKAGVVRYVVAAVACFGGIVAIQTGLRSLGVIP